MGWYVVTVAPPSAGDAIADHVLSRANNPATWSFECLGALVYRHRRGNADAFFFCPKAALVFELLAFFRQLRGPGLQLGLAGLLLSSARGRFTRAR